MLINRSWECNDQTVRARSWNLCTNYLDEQIRKICVIYRTVSPLAPFLTHISISICSNLPACFSHLSRFFSLFRRNSRAQNWSPSKNRFLDQSRRSREQPGPGAYNPSDVDSQAGSYIVSNFKNTGNVKFIKPATLHGGGGTALRSRTPMVNRAATSKC